jgi:hypothetical protein
LDDSHAFECAFALQNQEFMSHDQDITRLPSVTFVTDDEYEAAGVAPKFSGENGQTSKRSDKTGAYCHQIEMLYMFKLRAK